MARSTEDGPGSPRVGPPDYNVSNGPDRPKHFNEHFTKGPHGSFAISADDSTAYVSGGAGKHRLISALVVRGTLNQL